MGRNQTLGKRHPFRGSDEHNVITYPMALSAARDPIVFARDLIGDRSPVSVGARTKAESLLDKSARQRIQLSEAAGARDSATGYPAARPHGENHLNAAAKSAFAQVWGIIRRQYRSGDLEEVGPAFVAAVIALAPGASALCGSQGGPRARAAAGRGG
jgi:hypothetical protein